MNKSALKVALLGIVYLSFMVPGTAQAGTCRTLSAASPVSYITYPIGTSNTHIAERMRSGHMSIQPGFKCYAKWQPKQDGE